ncbi:carbon-nitrogen hydrolase family protein, partial [Neisseria gonorrhoeae]
MDKIRVAAVQMVSGVSPETNVAAMKRLVARAAEQGADWVLLPEYWVLMGANDTGKLALAEPLGGGRFQTALSETAKECGVVLFGGTVPLQSPEAGKVMNTLLVYGCDGVRTGLYHKMHLFGF